MMVTNIECRVTGVIASSNAEGDQPRCILAHGIEVSVHVVRLNFKTVIQHFVVPEVDLAY